MLFIFRDSLTSFVLVPLLRILQFVMKDFGLSSNSFSVVLNAGVVSFSFHSFENAPSSCTWSQQVSPESWYG